MNKVKVRLNIRLWKETKKRLKAAAEKLGVTETAIIEMALRTWFETH
jgi:predicted DNA-binding protein